MNPFYHPITPQIADSLHSLRHEHDNCGMGAIARLGGGPSHQILDFALTAVCNMTHRGAVDADMKTGDGSGVLTQIPHRLMAKAAAAMGSKVANSADIAVGMVFFPVGDDLIAELKQKIEETARARGIPVLGWRRVPVDPAALGRIALVTCPHVEQLLMQRPEEMDPEKFERVLYLCRRSIERQTNAVHGFYIPSFSSKLLSYKALAMPSALRAFYLDLQDSDFETAIALYHQRFSTNTFPAWPLGQPFRMMCHNGEINTVEGNRNWMTSREEFFAADVWGADIDLVKDLMRHGESDSASLDHALELLILSGRSPEHAMCMLVPPSYRNDEDISQELREFYRYIRSFSEPWDGPAGLVFTDGVKVCASLDRNGLRPSRYKITDDGLLYIGSEAGAVELADSSIVSKGRLGPGQMLSANTETGEIRFDSEIKESLARQRPYGRWLEDSQLSLRKFISPTAHVPDMEIPDLEMSRMQVAHGISIEELDMVFPPMIKGAQEAVYSMGDDIPLAVLSTYPRLLYTYFKQLFAQVTNPPIDPIREWAVMSLGAGLGPERNLLGEGPGHCRTISLDSAILFEHQLEKIKHLAAQGYPSTVLDCTWDKSHGRVGLQSRLNELCVEAEQAVNKNFSILILSDRKTSAERVPIPSLLIVGTIHHHLTRIRKRMRASIVMETGEARDVHQIACLFGFGATAVVPYLGYATVRQLVRLEKGREKLGVSAEKAMTNYRKALEKGLLKIMSKMGISVLNSYQGAQTFEAIGIGREVVDFAFSGVSSKLGGIGYGEIADESLIRHRAAYETVIPEGEAMNLGDPGYNRYRKSGERHAYTTDVIKNFHTYVRSGNAEDYEEYVRASLETNPIAIKDLIEFNPSASGPIPLEEVEPMEEIRRRFTTAAMSLGALSPEAHETLAIAMNRIGGKSDSGEGGEDPVRYAPYPNGDSANSYIKQVASGRFGVTAHYLVNAGELEIKMAQGAKPGEGGQLPGHKVNALIARLRNTQPGVQLISPPPHHDIYSIEDLAQLIHDLKEVNPAARITVKLVAESGVGTVAAGVAKASADNILISGHDGGTGASPLSSTKHAGCPWELGLAEAQQTLLINHLRDRVVLRTDGGIRNGRDVTIAAILGAEQFNFGTTALIAMGCVYVRKCHLNTCPVGITTTDPRYRSKFKGTPEMVIHYFNGVAEETRRCMAELGVRTLDELIGRPEFLKQRHVPDHPKANMLDLEPLLKDVVPELASISKVPESSIARLCTRERNDGIAKTSLDRTIFRDLANSVGINLPADDELPEYGPRATPPQIFEALCLLPDRQPVTLEYPVVNTDRNIGTRLSGRIAEAFGIAGLPEGSIRIVCSGSAGQSFGCFLVSGIVLELTGEANDYVGKGMNGGEIVLKIAADASFEAADNSICGNTCLYGATGGIFHANGRAGERFAVRNSGATAVVEGVGDHGCEYMTNGTILILGRTGKNFGAGMSGGTAYVLDEDGRFYSRINPEMVVALPVKRPQDIAEAREWIVRHAERTGSKQAIALLENWSETVRKLVRVIARERAELEAAEERHEAASTPIAR